MDKVYSKKAVALGAGLGGPLAGGYLMVQNAKLLGLQDQIRSILFNRMYFDRSDYVLNRMEPGLAGESSQFCNTPFELLVLFNPVYPLSGRTGINVFENREVFLSLAHDWCIDNWCRHNSNLGFWSRHTNR